MADDTIKLPKDAIELLLKLKRKNETITDVLMRIIGMVAKKDNFAEWIETKEPNEELASAIESVYQKRDEWTFRNFD